MKYVTSRLVLPLLLVSLFSIAVPAWATVELESSQVIPWGSDYQYWGVNVTCDPGDIILVADVNSGNVAPGAPKMTGYSFTEVTSENYGSEGAYLVVWELVAPAGGIDDVGLTCGYSAVVDIISGGSSVEAYGANDGLVDFQHYVNPASSVSTASSGSRVLAYLGQFVPGGTTEIEPGVGSGFTITSNSDPYDILSVTGEICNTSSESADTDVSTPFSEDPLEGSGADYLYGWSVIAVSISASG